MKIADPHNLNEFAELSANLQKLPPPPVPSGRLRAQLHAMIAEEKRATANIIPAQRHFGMSFFHGIAAAVAALIIGLFVGAHFLAPKPTIPTLAERELAALRVKVEGMDRLMTYSLLQQQTAGERFETVLTTVKNTHPDRHLLINLVGLLAFEPSPNIRLSVVDALLPHANDPLVRAGVLAVLPRETSASVQTAMIAFLAETRDTAAKPVLEKFSTDGTTEETVRDTARRAIAFIEQNTFDPPPKSILL